MTLEASFLVLALTILIQLFFALAVLSRSLTRATHFFAIQAGCLVAVFVTYALATGNHYLYIWAAVAAILAGWGLPYWPGGLLYSAGAYNRRSGSRPSAPSSTSCSWSWECSSSAPTPTSPWSSPRTRSSSWARP